MKLGKIIFLKMNHEAEAYKIFLSRQPQRTPSRLIVTPQAGDRSYGYPYAALADEVKDYYPPNLEENDDMDLDETTPIMCGNQQECVPDPNGKLW